MENGRIEGIGHQIKGGVKESLGKIIGDAKLAADGAAERTLGNAQNPAGIGTDQMFGIDTDRITGVGHQLKGTLMTHLGSVVGNPKMQADGIAERQAGKAQNAAGSGRDIVREAAEKLSAEDTHVAIDPAEKSDISNEEPMP